MSANRDPQLQRLRRLDCCALSDALDRLGLVGQVTHLQQFSGAGRISGRAVTVKLGVGQPAAGPARHLCCTAIESSDQDSVIVVEQHSGIEAGSWGGLLSLGAVVRGVAAVIADGPVRDIDESIGLGFPVFAKGLTSLTARGRISELGTHVPVHLGTVPVNPGDYLAGDRSAVIVIAAQHIEQVLTVAETIVAKEAAMAKAILAGTAIGQVMGGNYENMLKEC